MTDQNRFVTFPCLECQKEVTVVGRKVSSKNIKVFCLDKDCTVESKVEGRHRMYQFKCQVCARKIRVDIDMCNAPETFAVSCGCKEEILEWMVQI